MPPASRHTVFMEFDPRPLTRDERLVLDALLSADFDGVAEPREQAMGATVEGRCKCGCPSIDLIVGADAPHSAFPGRLSPVEGRIAPVGSEPPGDIILFLDGGRLSYLEYVYYQDDVPNSWPPDRAGNTPQDRALARPESASMNIRYCLCPRAEVLAWGCT
jgi:hypothetical protein